MKAGTQTRLIANAMTAAKEAAWPQAQALNEFGASELAAAIGCSLEKAQTIIKGWLVDGAVLETQMRHGPVRQRVKVTQDHVIARAADRSATDNMWHTVRRLRTFSPTDLAAHATTELIVVPVTEAAAYCRALLGAGYLRVSRKASPKSAREAIYVLARDSGPRAPKPRRIRAMVDANTGETYLLGGHE